MLAHNGRAWDAQARDGSSPWVQPADPAAIAAARSGDWQIILTPCKSVPRTWFAGALDGRDVLCLASGGGQQAPILAAAGARVTSFDYSTAQLELDAQVAAREALALRTIQGDMADLSVFADGSFDLIVHPVSNVFSRQVRPVWRECSRVLRPGGRLLSGFMNPDYYLFDHAAIESGGPLEVSYALPYSDERDLPPERRAQMLAEEEAFEFSHSLDEQIGGQLDAGLVLRGFYEDRWSDDATPLNRYLPTSMATLAEKPAAG
ncbi:MAG: class I SAM-dependent methyltransferase [Pseudomonadota bacterium]